MEQYKNARETAMKILYDVEKNHAYSNLAFIKHTDGEAFKKEDISLIKELCFGVLRYKITLDYYIQSFSTVKFKKISPYILCILRLTIYQLKFMDKIPQSAAVNEGVKLAKKYGHKASSGFVNGVCRSVAKADKLILPKDKISCMSIEYSYTEELVRFFIDSFGEDFAEQLLKAGNITPPVFVRVNTLKTSAQELVQSLEHEGVSASLSPLCGVCLRLENTGDIKKLKSYKNGLFTVQDQSSAICGLCLNPQEGETVLDICAAPGGKTTHLAEQMNNKGKIVALDLYEKRLKSINELSDRLDISIIEAAAADALVENSGFYGKFDKILCDVPCSGLGVIRRKPEIKYKENLTDFEELTSVQINILKNCSKYVKIDGEIVYSTCTVNRKEGIELIHSFLQTNKNFQLCPIDNPHILFKPSNGCIELFPNVHNTDGFFICKLKRIS